ncbi:MAG: hypothetical protein DMF54_07060 [Acidobacteria bacterium]|nr:MAG: hypothetical protein DMF55_08445 [Acidobacteriota bacterium]PYQ66673.1 MAG: hypothetical protein DMF54_07060 [Acidobacteriota bacterium]
MHHGPKGPFVVVSQTAAGASVDPIVISKGKHQQIVWRVRDGITNVAIKIGENPAPPFVDCRTDAGICRIDCEHRLCFSGSINPLLAVPPSRYFDYDFASSTAQASSDPGIRIDP